MLIVAPGEQLAMSYDERVIRAERMAPAGVDSNHAIPAPQG